MIISISPVFGTQFENNDTLTVDIDGPGLLDPVRATYYEVMYSGQRRITTAAFTVIAAGEDEPPGRRPSITAQEGSSDQLDKAKSTMAKRGI